ncbi:DUF2169 family type VI secretion system accessory protein [Polyangium aurulentum]|uniref:DUF2169 family type VI secretion system accessory protein n=1 Tax=Polyangium aurulentum TaxID=2567896 RepID=UPI0010AE1ED7|nr:DUF2169 domain-containing protein [Polyangium aurulentum]UQA56566.1 DUF2169 domain-containing protein [Polyangium aurulentum]
MTARRDSLAPPMELVSACPLPVAPLLWQPRPGAFCLTVVCKATFLLEPSRARLAPAQEPVREGDLVPSKPRADVVLVGHAFTPGGEPARALTARLVVGTLDKAIEIVCDRSVSRDGALREGAPFSRMPLVYERAAGGPDTWNPVGLRGDAWSAEGQLALPNLLPRGKRFAGTAGAFEPIGFGPIPPAWPLRRDRLGRHAALADPREWHRQPMPADMDLGYFNVAPPDQQIAAIDDDVRIALEHLHPERLLLVTRLPGLRPKALVDRPGGPPLRPALRADTLWIDTDRALCTLTYRGQVPLSHPDEAGRVLVTLMRKDEEATGPETPRAPAPTRSSAPPPLSEEAVPSPAPVFGPAPSPPAWSGGRSLWPRPSLSLVPPAGSEDETPAPPTMDIVTISPPPPPTLSPPPPPTMSPPPPPTISPATISPTTIDPPRSRLAEGEALSLLWYARESVQRIRRVHAWRAILDEAEGLPADPDLDDPEPAEAENRRHLAAILSRHAPSSPEALGEVLARGVRASTLAPTLALVGGDLVFPLDEAGLLKALVLVSTPLAAEDERLRAAVRAASEFAAMPGASSARAVAEGLGARIKEALRGARRGASIEPLEVQAERVALEGRAYQKRMLLGGAHLRALLVPELASNAAQVGVPVYLPERLAAELPIYSRFRARILAEVHPPVDAGEMQPVALRAVAVGRIVTVGRRG